MSETSLVFLLTLYMQKALGFSPLAAGLSFAVLGAGTVVGGMVAPRIIAQVGSCKALLIGFLAQAAAALPLAFLGQDRGWMVLLLLATFIGGAANLIAIVGFMVTATSGLPDHEQGLATGLATMSQQVGIALGIPVMSVITTAHVHALGTPTPQAILTGLNNDILVNAALCLLAAALLAMFLKPSSNEVTAWITRPLRVPGVAPEAPASYLRDHHQPKEGEPHGSLQGKQDTAGPDGTGPQDRGPHQPSESP